jgi:predicted aspartyl protease
MWVLCRILCELMINLSYLQVAPEIEFKRWSNYDLWTDERLITNLAAFMPQFEGALDPRELELQREQRRTLEQSGLYKDIRTGSWSEKNLEQCAKIVDDVVPVLINGAGPFDFMFDTGTTHTIIDRKLAEQLDLPLVGKGTVATLQNEAVMPVVHTGSISLAGANVHGLDIFVITNLESSTLRARARNPRRGLHATLRRSHRQHASPPQLRTRPGAARADFGWRATAPEPERSQPDRPY